VFGDKVDIEESIGDLITSSPRLVSTDAQMVLRDRYETSFKIYDHNEKAGDHPFALIMMNWNEDTVTAGSLHERMVQYIDRDIQKYFGISFNEFIEQPTYVIAMQLDIAEDRIRKEAPLNEAAHRVLQNLNNSKDGKS
jgi:hypothetical protein